MRQSLISRFPNLPQVPYDAPNGETMIAARDAKDTASISVVRDGIFTRVQMLEESEIGPDQARRFKELQAEIEILTRASDTTSHAIWQMDSHGRVIWHNAAYRKLYRNLHAQDPDPTKPVFDLAEQVETETDSQRVSTAPSQSGRSDWYDINKVELDDVTVFHATEVNAIVKSEIAQRNFVQTLAKTFAQLSIGLAIFDRNGQLALFNPALIDLTDLPAGFLSGRPTLMSFFDRIRENRRMPEPKNYQSWRQQIADVIAAATDGRYQETWTLESGQTYRVSGRPHPDGAIAFLIEDISAEISMTRNFRAELELTQSLMDSFEEALVVFSSTGVLTFSNLAYCQMWDMDPDNSFADVTIEDCIAVWKTLCTNGTDWDKTVAFVKEFGEKTGWETSIERTDGQILRCRVDRVASGATIIRFLSTNREKSMLQDGDRKSGSH
jgi:PAS domain-containing protein